MYKKLVILCLCVASNVAFSETKCTELVAIKDVLVQSRGWMHVVLEGVDNSDLQHCGKETNTALLFNFNDTYGSPEGQEMLKTVVLSAWVTGEKLMFCSNGCDSQYSAYSRLDSVRKFNY
jgi:hypothetical protein